MTTQQPSWPSGPRQRRMAAHPLTQCLREATHYPSPEQCMFLGRLHQSLSLRFPVDVVAHPKELARQRGVCVALQVVAELGQLRAACMCGVWRCGAPAFAVTNDTAGCGTLDAGLQQLAEGITSGGGAEAAERRLQVDCSSSHTRQQQQAVAIVVCVDGGGARQKVLVAHLRCKGQLSSCKPTCTAIQQATWRGRGIALR